jgi:hypothetical protein
MCQEPLRQFVAAFVRGEAVHTRRRHRACAQVPSLAISACLAVGILLTVTGTGLAISGFATNGPAVRAQYPDAAELAPDGKPLTNAPPSLMDIVTERRAIERSGRAAIKRRAAERKVEQRVAAALPVPSRMGVSESASIPLLMIGMGVLSVGGVLRWRRGAAQI